MALDTDSMSATDMSDIDSRLQSALGKLGNDVPAKPEATQKADNRDHSAPAADDEGPAEDPVTQDHEDDVDPGEPVIDAPSSWTAGAKKAFADLPRDLQEEISRREAEGKSALNRNLNDATTKREAAEAERKAAAGERAQLKQQLDQVVMFAQNFDPIISEGLKTDWDKLAREDPGLYVAKSQEFNARKQQIANWAQHRDQLAAQEANQRNIVEASRLVEKMPEWRDESKRSEINGNLVKYLTTTGGFSAKEAEGLTDHRGYIIAYKAMKYDQLMAAKGTAETKRAQPAPRNMRPGAASDTRPVASSQKIAALKSKSTGSMNDRLKIVMATIGER